MGFSAYQLAQNNKVALESFQKYHEQFKSQSGSSMKSNTSTQQQAPPMPNDFTAHEQDEIANMIRNMENDDVIDSSDPSIEVTEDYD